MCMISAKTQVLRVINSVCGNVSWGNCRGGKHAIDWEAESKPLPKHRKRGAENCQPQFCAINQIT